MAPHDLAPLLDTQPDLWRELYGTMAVCRKEIEDYGDPDDDDLDFRLASEDDDLTDLNHPEEWAAKTELRLFVYLDH